MNRTVADTMISRLEVYRYRCFSNLDIALKPYQVLAGANGSGKSTLLDLPGLFSELIMASDINAVFLEPAPSHAEPRTTHADDLIHNHQGNDFALAMEVNLPEHIREQLLKSAPAYIQKREDYAPDTLRYELRCEVFNDVLEISEESLWLFPEKHRPAHGEGMIGNGANRRMPKPCFQILSIDRYNRGRGKELVEFCAEWQKRKKFQFQVSSRQTALRNLPEDSELFPAASWFKQYIQQMCPYSPAASRLRQAVGPQYRNGFNAKALSLPWQVLALQNNSPDDYADWLLLVNSALPAVKKAEAVEREDDRHACLKITYQNGIVVSSPDLSDGTLHILALTILPYVKNRPLLIALEEPETGIHPRAVATVMEALNTLDNTVMWVSTHSPMVVAETALEHILCLRMDSKSKVNVMAGQEHPRLKAWQKDIDLGRLFAAGVFE